MAAVSCRKEASSSRGALGIEAESRAAPQPVVAGAHQRHRVEDAAED